MLVQFGNNWIQKIPLTAKLDSAYGLSNFGCPRNFFHPIISKLDKHVVLLQILIGLHAVQFGHNWMKKIPKDSQSWTSRRPSPIWLAVRGFFFNLIISNLDKHVVLLLINYIASQSIQQKIFEISPSRKPVGKLQFNNFRW